MLYGGKRSNPTDTKAFEFFSLAAAQGEANSQNWVGLCYKNGRGVAQSHEKAFQFFQKAAEQGLTGAQLNLGKRKIYYINIQIIYFRVFLSKWKWC